MSERSYLTPGYGNVAAQPVTATQKVASSAPALLQAATTEHRAGRLAAAEQLYRKILSKNPNHAEALDYLGILAHQQGRRDEAISLIEAAIRQDPQRPSYLSDLATVQQERGDIEAAIANLRRAITLDPKFADGHYNLGNALVLHGER